MAKRKNKWIQKTGVKKHKGALHRALGYAEGEKIPVSVLHKAVHKGGHLGHMAQFALNVRHFRHAMSRRRLKHKTSR